MPAPGYIWTQMCADNPLRERFVLYYGFPNWNATSLALLAPLKTAGVGRMAQAHTIMLERINLNLDAAAAGVIFGRVDILDEVPGTSAALPSWTSIMAEEGHTWDVFMPLRAANQETGSLWVQFSNISGYAVTDDAIVRLIGYYEFDDEMLKQGQFFQPQPVTLEGYKWPLTRR